MINSKKNWFDTITVPFSYTGPMSESKKKNVYRDTRKYIKVSASVEMEKGAMAGQIHSRKWKKKVSYQYWWCYLLVQNCPNY